MIKQVSAFALSVLLVLCHAASSGALTMEEAVGIALQNNHRIRQFENLEGSAREDIGSKRSAFWPSVDLSYSYSDVDVSGAASLGSSLTRDVAVGSVEASYNLFRGLSDIRGLRESRARAEASEYERRAVAADVVLDVKTAYINVLRARRAVQTAEEGVELLERQVREAEQFHRVGLLARNDVLKVAVELSSARQELLQARGDLRVAVKRLERAMGSRIAEDEVVAEIEGTPEPGAQSFDALSAEALGRRSELRRLRALHEAYGYGIAAIKGGYLPSIDFSLRYSQYGDNAGLDGRELLHDNETRATLSATWNVFDGLRKKHDVQKALYLQKATAEELKDMEEEVLLQLQEALEGYRVSRGKLEAAEAAVEQAEENYRVTDSQFRNRLATSTDLLDARFFLTRARNQRNNALYDIHAWAARLERAVEGFGSGRRAENEQGPR